jgi:V8-like Glu-specific endopeptidase
MTFWVRNENNNQTAAPRPAWPTDYFLPPVINGPLQYVVKLTRPLGEGVFDQGSGILIAPGLVLTASHVVKPGTGGQFTATLGASSFQGSDDVQLRAFHSGTTEFLNSDLAVLKIADTSVPTNALFGLMSFSQAGLSTAAQTALGREAATAGFPGNLYTTEEAAKNADTTKSADGPMYEMALSIAAGAQAGWTSAKVGADGHSGGGVWVDYTEQSGSATQKIVGNFTFANAAGENGDGIPPDNPSLVGGNLLRTVDKARIDDLLKHAGYNSGDLPADVIHGSDGDDRYALSSDDLSRSAALTGSFKSEDIYGGDGNDIIYTGNAAIDNAGADVLYPGAGADTLIFGNGQALIPVDPADNRANDRLAILADSIDLSVGTGGPEGDLSLEQMIVLQGGVYLLDESGLEASEIFYDSQRDAGANAYPGTHYLPRRLRIAEGFAAQQPHSGR